MFIFVRKNLMKVFNIWLTLLGLLGCAGYSNLSQKKIKAPFDGERFQNIEPFPDKDFFSVLKWHFGPKKAEWKKVENQTFFTPTSQRSKDVKITLIGHSTVLIQIDNVNILTDPHFSERASPVSWAGPTRVAEPAIKFENLPSIDVVLISHDHYDHLDIPTLKKLQKKSYPTILVGLGNNKLLASEGIENVMEVDWWDKFSINGINIHFTPVQHWSARGIFDKRKTLWGGFYIEASKKIFFAGDTGYGTGKVFNLIHQRYGNMDIGLIPIGAYEPRWFMKNAHINPEEAVKIFKDLGIQKAIGIHFATFAGLTNEPKSQPKEDLLKALKAHNIEEDKFIVPEFGKEYGWNTK